MTFERLCKLPYLNFAVRPRLALSFSKPSLSVVTCPLKAPLRPLLVLVVLLVVLVLMVAVLVVIVGLVVLAVLVEKASRQKSKSKI